MGLLCFGIPKEKGGRALEVKRGREMKGITHLIQKSSCRQYEMRIHMTNIFYDWRRIYFVKMRKI